MSVARVVLHQRQEIVVKADGDVRISSQLKDHYDAAATHPSKEMIWICFEPAVVVNTAILRTLTALVNRSQSEGVRMVFVGEQNELRNWWNLARLEQTIPLMSNVEEALTHFGIDH